MYLISACLCGVNCKYNGANNYNEICDKLFSSGKAILVCPEQLGGLPTPRIPSEIINYSKENSQKDITIINKNGDNVSKEFIKGAQEVLNIAKKLNIKKAILKEGSPSCGVNKIHNGEFKGIKKVGKGVTAALFEMNGIRAISEKDLEQKRQK